jgi:hypothetical protein
MPDKLKANDCLEVYESRGRLAFFLAGGVLLTLASLLMAGASIGYLLGFLGRASASAREIVSPIVTSLMGVVGIAIFGSAASQAACRLFSSRRPVILVAPDGFKDLRISAEWISWSTILSLKDYRGKGIVVDVDPRFVGSLRLGLVTRFTRTANRLFGHRGLWVAAFPLENMSAQTLLDIMRERMKTGGASGGWGEASPRDWD